MQNHQTEAYQPKWDNSSISTYQKCPQSYYLQYIKRIRKKYIDDSNAAKNFGDCFHKFVEAYLTKKPFLFDYYTQPDDLPQYSLHSIKEFCATYVEKYGNVDKYIELLEVENVSKFEIDGFEFNVKCDAVVRKNDNIYGLELKTTKSISQDYFSKYFINSQISAQTYAIKKKYGQCSGVILRVGENKILKRKPTSDSYDKYFQVEDGYITNRFVSDYVNRSNYELEDWEQNTSLWIKSIDNNIKNGLFPKSTGLWGGTICSKCEYRDLCKVSSINELDDSVMDIIYEECDPTKYLDS